MSAHHGLPDLSGPAGGRTNGTHGPDPLASAPTIAQVVDGVFTRLDANTDGSITLTELLAVIDPDGDSTSATTLATSVIAKIDANVDSALSKAELTTAVTALDTNHDGRLDRSEHAAGAPQDGASDPLGVLLQARLPHGDHAEPAARTIAAVVDGVFTRFDADASTTITLSELLAVLDLKATRTDFDARVASLVTQLDSNADHGLSRAEITAAVTQLDTDQSGTLDRADHVSGAMAADDVALIGILLHDGHGPGF